MFFIILPRFTQIFYKNFFLAFVKSVNPLTTLAY